MNPHPLFMFRIKMNDVSDYSVEEYYVMAIDEDAAWDYVVKDSKDKDFAERLHSIICYTEGEIIRKKYEQAKRI